jgi:hypothetical protein
MTDQQKARAEERERERGWADQQRERDLDVNDRQFELAASAIANPGDPNERCPASGVPRRADRPAARSIPRPAAGSIPRSCYQGTSIGGSRIWPNVQPSTKRTTSP